MKRPHFSPVLAASAFAGLLALPQAVAATASTGALGYTTVQCLWSSDTLCSTAGITEKPDFIGKVASAAGATITVDASPAWGADAFAGTHYVRFTTGSNIGRYYTVTGNGANTLTIDLGGDDLSGVVADDGVKLVKYWTLGSLFPVDNQATIIQSAGNLGFQRRTEVLFPDLVSEGINLSPPNDTKFFLVAGSGWRSAGTGFPASDDVQVLPDMYFIVRHPAAPVGTDPSVLGTEFVPMGHVEEAPTTISLATRPTGSGQQDNSVAISRPVAVTLAESDLISSGAFLPSANGLGFNRRDELLVFDLDVDTISPDDSGINRAQVQKYYFNNSISDGMTTGHWVNVGTGTIADNELVFQPGSGVKIRKYNTAGGATSFWVFDPAN